MKVEWPREIVVCLECGAVSGRGEHSGSFVSTCSGGSYFHAPTQTVSVMPTSSVSELVEEVERCCDLRPPRGSGWTTGDSFRIEAGNLISARLKAALDSWLNVPDVTCPCGGVLGDDEGGDDE